MINKSVYIREEDNKNNYCQLDNFIIGIRACIIEIIFEYFIKSKSRKYG
ncbi:MAG: hypothetical protein HW421_1765 [Ignavibacteria bacterium]|nr:hypothetical protein [Ignavibacteria bacterium]